MIGQNAHGMGSPATGGADANWRKGTGMTRQIFPVPCNLICSKEKVKINSNKKKYLKIYHDWEE